MDILEIAKTPISESAPGGDDARYEPEYEQMQAEVGKLTSPTAAGGIDWKKLEALTSKILAEKSKDTLAAGYLMAALLHNEGVEGLDKGLVFFRTMIETFWEDMFPAKKRMRGRKNAVEWFYEHSAAFLEANEPKPVPEEKLKSILENFEAISSFLGENMEEPPYGREFMERLNMIPVTAAPQAAPAPAPAERAADAPAQAAPPPPPPPPPSPSPAADAPDEIASVQDAKKTVNAALKLLKSAGKYYLDNEPANPISYALNRMAAWMQVEALPPAENGVTKIPPPPDQVKGVLDKLYSDRDWENLLKAAEPKVGQFLFWLDLSRMAHESLGKMGEKYQAAQEALAERTAAFVNKFPGIENYSFSDETPFADNATKLWLTEILASQGGGVQISSPTSGKGDGKDKVAEEFDKAMKLARDKKLPEAAEVLQANLESSPSGKEKMLWRIALIQLLVASGKGSLAVPHAERAIQDIESRGLAEWDPDLALEAYKAALPAFRTQADETGREKAEMTLASIAGLRPSEALKLEK